MRSKSGLHSSSADMPFIDTHSPKTTGSGDILMLSRSCSSVPALSENGEANTMTVLVCGSIRVTSSAGTFQPYLRASASAAVLFPAPEGPGLSPFLPGGDTRQASATQTHPVCGLAT